MLDILETVSDYQTFVWLLLGLIRQKGILKNFVLQRIITSDAIIYAQQKLYDCLEGLHNQVPPFCTTASPHLGYAIFPTFSLCLEHGLATLMVLPFLACVLKKVACHQITSNPCVSRSTARPAPHEASVGFVFSHFCVFFSIKKEQKIIMIILLIVLLIYIQNINIPIQYNNGYNK